MDSQSTTFPYIDTDDTVRHMLAMVESDRGERSWVLRELLENVVRYITPKDQLSQIAAVYNWFFAHLTYVYDPLDAEQVKDPERLAEEIKQHGKAVGDCDDISTFLVAAYRALGIPANFVRVGFDESENLSHVFVIARDQYGRVIVVDPVANGETQKMLGDIKRMKI